MIDEDYIQSRKLTILVCPLDWGLGHASRMIPVIDHFVKDGHKVILAGSGRSGELLKTTYPGLTFLSLPSYFIHLGEGQNSYMGLMRQIPGLIRSVFREHSQVKNLVRQHFIDIVISDNRYGLFCQSAYTVFVTHQISPVLPRLFRWLEYPLYRIIRRIIGFFDLCWIPDNEDSINNLSGKLSHRYILPANARFIGILSRFSHFRSEYDHSGRSYSFVAVLSGPEPQISAFESLVCKQLHNLPITSIVIRGMRGERNQPPPDSQNGPELISHLEKYSFARVLMQADLVICRSGYSGIMDLVALGIRAILVPTPGQSEQEYLATYLSEKGWFPVVQQNRLNLPGLLENKVKMSVLGFDQNLLQPGQYHFQDLYRKYAYHGEKSYYKA